MTSKELEATLGDAKDALQRKPANPEIGLEYVFDPPSFRAVVIIPRPSG